MTQPPETDPAPDPKGAAASNENTFYEKPAWKKLYAFILGPMLVAAAGVAIFVGVNLMTADNVTAQDLVETLRSGAYENHRRPIPSKLGIHGKTALQRRDV